MNIANLNNWYEYVSIWAILLISIAYGFAIVYLKKKDK